MRSLLLCLLWTPLFLHIAHCWPFDLPLVVNRPQFVKQGEDVSFFCSLASTDTLMGDTCMFITPHGRHYMANVTDGQVYDENLLLVPAFEAIQGDSEGPSCGLRAQSFDSIFAGQWSCILNMEPYHRGTFHIFMENGAATHVTDGIRLPRHVIPSEYELELNPNIAVGQFDTPGFLKVHFVVEPEVGEDEADLRKIVLHSKETLIDEGSIVLESPFQSPEIVGLEYDLEREFFVIHLAEPLLNETFANEYTLSLNFTSYLNDKLVGFYRSTYLDPITQEPKILAVTQFEATDARRAFPCLDEPDMKARFKVKLGHALGTEAVSNMDVLKVTNTAPDRLQTEFHETEVMSTYLLAFLISEFEVTVSELNSNFSIYHMPGKSDQATLASEVGPRVLAFYEDYFGIDYPLPKMDMAAIPDFDAGAMENWGLITYREVTLLYQEGVSSKGDEDRVVEVIAHELAHQWFGNLVTMKWWTDLWLNEGFATYVENIGSNVILPDNEKLDRVVIVDLHDVFGIDALESSKPISVDVANPDYDMTYGRLSYGKGNCLIRMVENFIKLPTFQKGINQYLKSQNYDNADRNDLWNALDKAAKEDFTLSNDLNVAEIMENWTVKEGYPVIYIEMDGPNRLAKQKRFFLDPDAEESILKYFVPISWTKAGESFEDAYPQAWLKPEDEFLSLDIPSEPEIAYILNVNQTGYYRVNYESDNWNKITQLLTNEPTSIGKLNRAQILDDSFNLARAGQLAYPVPLDISLYLNQEGEYIPLQAGLKALQYIEHMVWNTPEEYSLFQGYIKFLLVDTFTSLGFGVDKADTYVKILKQKLVIEQMCFMGYTDCVSQAQAEFGSWMANPSVGNPINPDLRQIVYEVAIRNGGEAEFDFLLGQLSQVEVDQDIQKIIYGLGHSIRSGDLNRLLNLTLVPDGPIRAQDFRSVYRSVGSTQVGRRVQFEWIKGNLDPILDLNGPSVVSDIVMGFIGTANTGEEIDEFNQFVQTNQDKLTPVMASLTQGLDQAQINLKWTASNLAAILSWFEDGPFSTTAPSSSTMATETSTNPSDSTTTSATTEPGDPGNSALSLSGQPKVLMGLVSAIVWILWG